MGDTSTAVALNRVSRITGYSIQKGFFNPTSPNLPQRIAILAEANHANQSSFTANTAFQLTSASQAGSVFGYGSPIYNIARILFPANGSAVLAPVYVYPQTEAAGAAAQVGTLTVGGSTSAVSGTLQVYVSGRTSVDGAQYNVAVTSGMTAAQVATAIYNAINAVLTAPITATNGTSGVVTSTTKWYGLTAEDTNITVVDTIGTGLTYTWAITTHGSGTPATATALTNFGSDWNTIVINSYGLISTTIQELETANGIPDPSNPTGRYAGIVMNPFIACSGTLIDSISTLSNITNNSARLNQVTIAVCPAPNSLGYSYEAAANVAYLFANGMTNAPHLDIAGQAYPDMPYLAGTTFQQQIYTNRDLLVKDGCSTVNLVNGVYTIQDFVTTYHPTGETPPIFSKCRDIMGVDMNIYFTWKMIELANVTDHVIANDTDVVTASKVIKPKDVKSLIYNMATDLVSRALIADAKFMQSTVDVEINGTNPQRLDCTWSYKRTGNSAIVATTVTAGFNF